MDVSFKWLVLNNVGETWWLNEWLAGVAHGPTLISYINLACFALGCNKETRANKYWSSWHNTTWTLSRRSWSGSRPDFNSIFAPADMSRIYGWNCCYVLRSTGSRSSHYFSTEKFETFFNLFEKYWTRKWFNSGTQGKLFFGVMKKWKITVMIWFSLIKSNVSYSWSLKINTSF